MTVIQALTATVSVLAGSASPAQAALIIGIKEGNPKTAHKDPYTVSLKPTPVQPLAGPTDADLDLLRKREEKREGKKHKSWEFKRGGAAPGTFEVLQYAAFIEGDIGGADFVVLYDDGIAKARTDYGWIQIARPEDWGDKGSKTNVDAKFLNFPFYGNNTPPNLPTLTTKSDPATPAKNPGWIFNDPVNFPQQKIQNPKGGGKIKAGDLLFVDEPFCPLTCANRDGHAQDIFDLFLVEFTWNGKYGNKSGGTIKIMDGIRWGVEITCPDDEEGDDACHASIPEPSAAMLVVLAGMVLGAVRLRSTTRSRRALLGAIATMPAC